MKKIIAKQELAKEIVKDYFQSRKAFREIWKACEKGQCYTPECPKWLVMKVRKNYHDNRDLLFGVLEDHTGREVLSLKEDNIVHFVEGEPMQLVW